MDEKHITKLINNLDNHLFCQELDNMMDGIEIDYHSIAEKARWKLGKEQRKMQLHKRKVLSVIAASLVLVLGITTAYAAEISAFLKSLSSKTGVYATVVDGPAYYLERPLELGANQSLVKAMFASNHLELRLIADPQNRPDVKLGIGGKELEPDGFMGERDGMTLVFYNLPPTDRFDLIVGDKSYPVALSGGNPIVDGSDIIEAESSTVTWVSMGYKKIDNGIQILTAFDDRDLRLRSLVIPESDKVTETFSRLASNSYFAEFMPLIGYDAEGKAYEYHYDANDMGRPLTKFTSNAPDNKQITLNVPGIVVSYDKSFADLNAALPAAGEKQEVNGEINLSLQKMVLQSIERTSDTTARLVFKLNTGDKNNVRIRNAIIQGDNIDSGELLWENGICTMDVTLSEPATQINLQISHPSFIVDGDWTMLIE